MGLNLRDMCFCSYMYMYLTAYSSTYMYYFMITHSAPKSGHTWQVVLNYTDKFNSTIAKHPERVLKKPYLATGR